MRFAALQGSGASDYAAAGKKVANEAVNTFAVQRKSGPDYGEIAKTGMKARSAEKRAGMEAGAQVAKAGINAYTQANKVRIAEDAKAEVRGIAKDMRKAGGVAALGSVAAAGFLAFSDNDEKEPPSNTDAKRDLINQYIADRDAATRQRESERTDYQPIGELQGSPTGASNSSTNSSSSSTSSSGTSGGASAGKTTDPSDTGSRYMSFLTQSGLSKTQAAALTGHMDVESDSFRADTEYAPNAYGTRGRGHLQWTDTGNSGGRRTNFETFASSKGLDPTSFEANSQFLLSEMQGNHGNHWTNGGSYQGFLQQNTIEGASQYLQNNYIRPGVPHTQRRLTSAQKYFNNFQSN